jgi:hypothetical protein
MKHIDEQRTQGDHGCGVRVMLFVGDNNGGDNDGYVHAHGD